MAISHFAKGLTRAATLLADQANDYGSYSATLQQFAASLDDGHVASNSLLLPRNYTWPGFLVAPVDGQWRVLPHGEEAGLPAPGSQFLGCGGVSAVQMAETHLAPYVASWSLFAQR